jgi:protein subunit release factor A
MNLLNRVSTLKLISCFNKSSIDFKIFRNFHILSKKKNNLLFSLFKTNSIQKIYFNTDLLTPASQEKLKNAYKNAQDYISDLLNEREIVEMKVNTKLNSLETGEKTEIMNRLEFLNRVQDAYTKIKNCENDFRDLIEMSKEVEQLEPEMIDILKDDLVKNDAKLKILQNEMVQILMPFDLEDRNNSVVELTAGVGGAESRLFCYELFSMYQVYAALNEWQFNVIEYDAEKIDNEESIRKCSIEIIGKNVFELMKFESGVHRVQRIPKTGKLNLIRLN